MTASEVARRRTLPGWILAAGDVAAIVVFVLVGLRNHREGINLAGIARTALPVLGAWLVVSLFTRPYANGDLRRLLLTWVVAVPIGIAVRAIALHRAADDSQLQFGAVAMIATLVFLLAWRGLAALATRRG